MCIVRLIIIDSSTRKLKNMCATKLFLCLSALLPLLSFNQAILLKSLVMFAENVTCHHISSHPLLHILKDQEGLTCQQQKMLDLYFEERAWKAQCGVLVAL